MSEDSGVITTTTRLLVLDAGQTGIRSRVYDENGRPHELPELPGVRNNSPLVPQWADNARICLTMNDGSAPLYVAIGSTGRGERHLASAVLAGIADLGVQRVALAHDSISNYLGALDYESGVIVASGTGVITYGVGKTMTARVDGWGSQLGDDGSGFSIGRAALCAVMRDYDGRGAPTALTAMISQDFDDLEQAYLDVQNDPNWVRRIASYSKVVAGLAAVDEVARNIIRSAASELAHSVATAARRVGENGSKSTRVATLGGVFRSAELQADFAELLAEKLPAARIVLPKGDALAGACKLFSIPADSPLRAKVSYAG
ncbi:MAG: ATPase [Propionibacteriaceae bacterium]|nr:ATPase [Propionibacteriaceae bacterium]